MRSSLLAALVLLLTTAATFAQTRPAPDANKYPQNAAAVEAAKLEIEHPPEGTWATPEEMLRHFMTIVYATMNADDEPRPVKLRRFADLAGTFAMRYPAHEYSYLMLVNRWGFLTDDALGDEGVDLAERELNAFIEVAAPLPDDAEQAMHAKRIDFAATREMRAWKEAHPTATKADGTPPPDFAKSHSLVNEVCDQGHRWAAARGLREIADKLRDGGWNDEAVAIEQRIATEFGDVDPPGDGRGPNR